MVALLTGAQRNSAPLRTVIEMLQFGVPRLAGSLELALSSLGANAVLLSAKNLSNLYRNLSGRAEMVQTSPSRELTSRPDPRTAPPDCLGTFLGRLLLRLHHRLLRLHRTSPRRIWSGGCTTGCLGTFLGQFLTTMNVGGTTGCLASRLGSCGWSTATPAAVSPVDAPWSTASSEASSRARGSPTSTAC